MMKLKDINEEIIKVGLADFGWIEANELSGYGSFLKRKPSEHKCYLEVGYHKEDCRHFQPRKIEPWVQSILVIFYPYHMPQRTSSAALEPESHELTTYKISKAAVFQDYHSLVKEQLSLCHKRLETKYGGFFQGYTDTGPLNDRSLALKTGKLKLGRSSMLIHPTFGTRFYIGYLLTSLTIEDMTTNSTAVTQIEDIESYYHPFCKACGRCQKSCPNQAILGYESFNANRCIAYLTQSNRWTESLDELDEKDLTLNGYIYGCDTCQEVCPLNGISLNNYMHTPLIKANYLAEELMTLSNRQHKTIFSETSCGWIGNRKFKRNLKANQ